MYKVIGIKNINYTSKAGHPVKGVELHVTHEDKRVEGVAVDTIFVSDRTVVESGYYVEELQGATLTPLYNKYGKIERIELNK